MAPTAVFRLSDLPWKRQITYLWREHTIVPFTRAWVTGTPEPPTTSDILAGTWTLTTLVPLGSACPQSLLRSMYEPSLPRLQTAKTDAWGMTIRQQLTEVHGVLCALCQVHVGEVIDHDHITGVVRGYLCNSCNSFADSCTHSNDCPVAEYLNCPPARELALLYGDNTKKKLQRRSERFSRLHRLVDALGIPSP